MDADTARLAERMRTALLERALAAYEDGAIQGLCCEGAWEAAVSAMRRLDPRTVLPADDAVSTHHVEDDGGAAFDFLIGSWAVRNRRLKERLKGSGDWEEFESTCHARAILGGLGNMDEFIMERASGRVEAMTVRLYNPVADEWSIYWAAGTGNGRLDVPMVGRFEGPRGEFFSQEVFEGRHIFNRFVWTVETPDACRWEQATQATEARRGRPIGSWNSVGGHDGGKRRRAAIV